jgi:hypothetical protein
VLLLSQGWRRFTTGPFTCSVVEGNHLWPLQKEAKAAWLTEIVEHLNRLVPAGKQQHEAAGPPLQSELLQLLPGL